MGILDSLAAGAGSALLQRTFMMRAQGSSIFGIPQILAVFDAVLEEEPVYTADVTEHPVEKGPEITDHIQLKNPTLRIKGTISNTPIDLSVSVGNAVAGGIDLITSSQARDNLLDTGLEEAAGSAGATLMGQGGGVGGAVAAAADSIARTILLSAMQQRFLVDIITKRQRYPNMAIRSLSFPRDSSTGAQLVFDMEMIQVKIVSPLLISISDVAQSVINSAVGTTDLGSQSTSGVSDAVSGSANKSWLRSVIGG